MRADKGLKKFTNRGIENSRIFYFEIVILIQIRKLTWMHVHVARADHLTKRVGILSPLYSHSVTIVHFTFGVLCGVPFSLHAGKGK